MALNYAAILAEVLQYLQDSGAAIFATAETQYGIENELKTISRYSPQIIDVIYKLESRTGTDVTGTTSSLTDLVKLQFVAADATDEKVVYNSTDHTWAVVLTNSSTSVNTLSADIMDANEKYEIYNKRCRNKRQIYIGDMPSYLFIKSVEYPIGTPRNYTVVSDDVIEIAVNRVPDSDSTLTSLNDMQVLVKYAIPQVVCQLADLAGAVHTAGAAGATSMQVKSFTDDEIAEVGDIFTIANHRSTYIVTTALTFATQAAGGSSLSFYPELEAATVADDVITFKKSSLRPSEENYLIRLVSGRAAISKSSLFYQQVNTAITQCTAAATAIAAIAAKITQAVADAASARTQAARGATAVDLANVEFDLMNAEVDLAKTALASGNALVNTIPIGGGAAEYMGQASSDVGVSQGYLITGQSYLQEASADHSNAAQYASAAAAELRGASEKANEAVANLRLVAARLQVSQGGLRYETWGRNEVASVEAELRSLVGTRTSHRYPRD